jgi:PadR family transcriptional regulator PadR
MRRKPGAILPIEESVLAAASALNSSGDGEFHGFEMAKRLQDIDDARNLTAHGTLYKALSRMEKAGLLESRWEDPQKAADDGRPRRRLYRVTGAGEVALSKLAASRTSNLNRSNPGLATS